MNAQTIRTQFMSQFNLTDAIVHTTTINTGDTPGPTYISAHPDHDSVIKPTYVTIQNIDEFKQFGGNPDEVYHNNLMAEHHAPLAACDAALTSLPYSDLSVTQKSDLCQAYQTYIYGNSQNVQSYKDALQKHFFPAQLAVFAAQDVVVTKDNPLILSGNGDQPASFSFGTVTIQPGGQIINQANATLLADNLIQQTDNTTQPTNNFISVGPDGQSGAAGGNGGNGNTGNQGSAGSDGKSSCSTGAGQGDTGGTGYNGTGGGNGSRGTDAQVVRATFTTVEGPVILMSCGGNGGAGGVGGNGGNGGQGGPGGSSSTYCGTGAQGKGGQGGTGGSGGAGGDSGNGQNIYCTYQTLGTNGSISLGTPTKGQGGQGGAAGNGGNGGTGNPNGNGASAGTPGANGKNGTLGTVYINNVPQG
ncbi:hypothetical protein PAECIP111893_00756 [Paenibacillus plantiphilus]|uniref:Collagen triple helix repeat-containing protein n=1 Tax=Paenibacillus plantiphilus TaxID=2905650 RepID=A0ABN8G0M1_9BACL|nr:hypothetical protein [Paenibacillus plantiphilus]CAH1195778.1 hypothetical protein PAECIP111893_00756 [Paenibacillus plantiphilus]